MGSGLTRPSIHSGYRYGSPLETGDTDDVVCTWIGTSLELPPKPFRLETNFQIHSLVGTGMLGRVRLVQHKRSRKYFALKTLKKTEIMAQSMLSHVEREREAFVHLTMLQTPFLAKCFGSVQSSYHVHLILEYVPGGELRRRLHQMGGIMSPDEAKFYAAELVVFVGFCHRHGYMYRDLKPENILLDAYGHVKVVDLGFVRRFDDPGERCMTSVGTPQYLAPEQLTQSKDRRSYTCIVDWWALACVVFELVTGRTPFSSGTSSKNESPFEVYTRIVQGRIQWPRGISATLKDLLRQMLQPNVATRLCDDDAIRQHAWFHDVDWQEVQHGDVAPPFRPRLTVEGDRACFDEYADDDRDLITATNGTMTIAFATEFRNF